MNARAHPMIESGAQVCVLVTASAEHGLWLSNAAMPRIAVEAVPMDTASAARRVALVGPAMAVVDFSAPHGEDAAAMVEALRASHPELALIGMGTLAEPAAMLGALRAGVRDFIDMGAQAADAVKTLHSALRKHQADPAVQGKLALLLGGRGGLGVTTLACNLALMARAALQQRKAAAEVALLDLGMPCADSLLYLDARGEFSFVDAVRNLKRIDQTLAHTAFLRHADGLRILPLPANLGLMREISHGDSVALVRKLRSFFAAQVADLGGFSNMDFLVQLLRGTDGGDPQRVWMVCDQSVGAIVSTARMLAELTERGVDLAGFGLVVNRFDTHAGMPARDIAQRIGLPLEAVIPARGTALLKASSAGKPLALAVSSDPYLDAVSGLVDTLLTPAGERAAPAEGPWWRRAARLGRAARD